MMALSAKTLPVALGPPHVVHAASRISHFSAPKPLIVRHIAKAVDLTSPSVDTDPLTNTSDNLEGLISTDTIKELESVLDNGASVAALRRFNDLLAALPAESWEMKLAPVMNELAYNLESFNPAFAAVVLRVQCTIGKTDYVRRGAP
jgi:hypothetical protein